ncbi:MAG: sigma-70 family RNA polymerase sigma factor [Bacteroidales bacterium]|nr:sigma-70 family RNA polymerase sigma factor [Bacteroidales bacterium]
MYKELDEQELAAYCIRGDRSAEDELYTRYAAKILTLCRRYTDNLDDAKDLMQESLIQALDKIQTFKYVRKGSLYAWISRIAINKAINQIKRQRWNMVSLDSRAEDTIPEPTEEEIETIPHDKLLEWISKLPDVRKAVFNLYCIDGYSHKAIGEMLGISEKGSAGILAKARKQLKEEIRNYLKETQK